MSTGAERFPSPDLDFSVIRAKKGTVGPEPTAASYSEDEVSSSISALVFLNSGLSMITRPSQSPGMPLFFSSSMSAATVGFHWSATSSGPLSSTTILTS